MQDHERCLSPNPPERRGRISPASALSGISCPVSADGAQPTLPSSLALPCPEKHPSSSLASSKTDGTKHHTKALVSPVALHPCAPGDVCCDPLCSDMFILFNKYFFTGSREPSCPSRWTCWRAGGGTPESSAGRAWAVRPQGTASSRQQQHPSDTPVMAEVKFAEKIGLTRFFGGEHALQDPYESKSA